MGGWLPLAGWGIISNTFFIEQYLRKYSRLKLKKVHIALYRNPSQSYGVSLAIWDHTVLAAIQRK